MGLNRYVGLDNVIGMARFKRRLEVIVVEDLEDGIVFGRALEKILQARLPDERSKCPNIC